MKQNQKAGIGIVAAFVIFWLIFGNDFDASKATNTNNTNPPTTGDTNVSSGNQTTTTTGPCLVRMPDQFIGPNGEVFIKINYVFDVDTEGVPVNFYPPGSRTPIPYIGKGDINIIGGNIHTGTWRVTGPPGTLIRLLKHC
ncbi:MAG: hypothetical protein NT068_03075 [Candidatus Nomurabacteria bacterium]|nr:hypothetical protein [Candidatus Nomurabacteria bacterium]